ncbi:Hypothetical predicted protein [Pelobates cultripes]|uniref:Uncharacterized protein n=1 Tax=Pelobates cultripes TaxID=61616 RepID=A0AAD1TIX5_PELCU|nr:Hypothetical predicted protein [Pelobates cultripes]
MADHTYTFACIYSPDIASLDKFREGLLPLAGDLNIPLDPHLDTSWGTSTMPAHCIGTALRSLGRLGLVDYSAVHGQYSRIDLVFMSQECLTLLHDANIGIIHHSDHVPVTVCTNSPLFKPKERQWKLNDLVARSTTTQTLTHYFDTNNTPDISPLTL